MEQVSRERLVKLFPGFRGDGALVDAVLAGGVRKELPAGSVLYHSGDRCESLGLFLAGQARVFAVGRGQREITLYEILPGEACILNASCVISRRPYPAEAVTVEATEALVLTAERFRQLVAVHEAMRAFVFSLFTDRLAHIMELVEEVAFGSIERRLDDYLVEKAEDDLVRLTHLAIAKDLGTSREVVSRVLKELERQGRLRLGRNEIRLVPVRADAG